MQAKQKSLLRNKINIPECHVPLEPDEVKQVRSDDYLWRPAFPLLVHLVTGKCFKFLVRVH